MRLYWLVVALAFSAAAQNATVGAEEPYSVCKALNLDFLTNDLIIHWFMPGGSVADFDHGLPSRHSIVGDTRPELYNLLRNGMIMLDKLGAIDDDPRILACFGSNWIKANDNFGRAAVAEPLFDCLIKIVAAIGKRCDSRLGDEGVVRKAFIDRKAEAKAAYDARTAVSLREHMRQHIGDSCPDRNFAMNNTYVPHCHHPNPYVPPAHVDAPSASAAGRPELIGFSGRSN